MNQPIYKLRRGLLLGPRGQYELEARDRVQIQEAVDDGTVRLRVLNRTAGVGPDQTRDGDIVVKMAVRPGGVTARERLEQQLQAASNVQ